MKRIIATHQVHSNGHIHRIILMIIITVHLIHRTIIDKIVCSSFKFHFHIREFIFFIYDQIIQICALQSISYVLQSDIYFCDLNFFYCCKLQLVINLS